MKFNPDIHRRRSIRLKGYDYTHPGMYFVTIVVQNRECLFGRVEEEISVLNEAGQMVQAIWDDMPAYYPNVALDERVIMPNHIHGIIMLNVGAGPCACPDINNTCPDFLEGTYRGVPLHPMYRGAPTLSLSDVIHRFKSLTTARYRQGVVQNNWSPFYARLWHRNYYEHIIRDDKELYSIREYIKYNPRKWELDEENPIISIRK